MQWACVYCLGRLEGIILFLCTVFFRATTPDTPCKPAETRRACRNGKGSCPWTRTTFSYADVSVMWRPDNYVWFDKLQGTMQCCYSEFNQISNLYFTHSVVQEILWKLYCVLSLSKNSPHWRFITVFTKACHHTLSWASCIQFTHWFLSP